MTDKLAFFEFFFCFQKPQKTFFYVIILPINLFEDSKDLFNCQKHFQRVKCQILIGIVILAAHAP